MVSVTTAPHQASLVECGRALSLAGRTSSPDAAQRQSGTLPAGRSCNRSRPAGARLHDCGDDWAPTIRNRRVSSKTRARRTQVNAEVEDVIGAVQRRRLRTWPEGETEGPCVWLS